MDTYVVVTATEGDQTLGYTVVDRNTGEPQTKPSHFFGSPMQAQKAADMLNRKPTPPPYFYFWVKEDRGVVDGPTACTESELTTEATAFARDYQDDEEGESNFYASRINTTTGAIDTEQFVSGADYLPIFLDHPVVFSADLA